MMTDEIAVRVESRVEAEWLWSRLLGARIESEPLRVVIDPTPSVDSRLARVIDTVRDGIRLRALRGAELDHDGHTIDLTPVG
jgi:hypothetical protein